MSDNNVIKIIDNEILDDEEESTLYCDEGKILGKMKDEFHDKIKRRGKDYYYLGNVLKCFKDGNSYVAKVKGSLPKPYTVKITNSIYDGIKMECDCPCDYPCKHEYAALMAISNQEYKEVTLKPELTKKKKPLCSIIESIPAEEIKSYLLSPVGEDYVCFEMMAFEKYFIKYLPKQDYDFYYNNLYNKILLEEDTDMILESYLDKTKQYIDGDDFVESFKIIKSIIEAYNDSNRLNFDDCIIDTLSKIGMFLRIIYRKCDIDTKKDIDEWAVSLKDSDYYDNYYLEDIIKMVKSI